MPWWMLLGGALCAICALLFSGIPIFIAFMIVNVVGIVFYFGYAGFGLFTNSLFETTSSPILVALPLFVLMGELLFHSGSVDVLHKSLDRLIGRSRLRDYHLVIALSTVLGALSGSAMAVVAMLGRSVLPGMVARGYDRRLSIGTILAGGSLAPIIPPSITVILIGGLANVSIADLLIGGIGPGLLLAVLFLGYVWFSVRIDTRRAPSTHETQGHVNLADRAIAIARMLPFGFVIFAVLGTVMAGIATPEEAAATGVAGAILVAAIYGRLSAALIVKSVGATARITAMILVIIMSSKVFGQLLAYSGATSAMISDIVDLELGRWYLLILLMLFAFIWCMFLDPIALMLIVVPLYVPLLKVMGFDPVWFWILFLVNITIGGLTPPFGFAMFALKGAAPEVPMTEIFAAAWPFVVVFLIGLVIIALVPAIVTYLPGHS